MLRTTSAWAVQGSSDQPAPRLTSARLANASLVEPLLHGDGMDGLSGLYAIINAIQVAVAHNKILTAYEIHTLMRAGFDFLSGRLTPLQAFQSGCRVSVWRGLARAMVEVSRIRLGAHLRVERLLVGDRSRAAAFEAIEQAIAQWRPVLMLCRGGRYTVVSGSTPSSLLLFDSGGSRWMAKHACGAWSDNENARHILYPGSFMALSA